MGSNLKERGVEMKKLVLAGSVIGLLIWAVISFATYSGNLSAVVLRDTNKDGVLDKVEIYYEISDDVKDLSRQGKKEITLTPEQQGKINTYLWNIAKQNISVGEGITVK